jgi:hypothetical protein
MVVIFAGVLALGVFVAQCEAARRGSFSAHVGALVEAVLLLPLAGLGALLGLILYIAMTLAAACFGAWAAFLAPLGNGLGI